jgi:hypothetical protein
MTVTPKRLLIAAAVVAVALLAYVWLSADDNSLPLNARVTGTVNGAQASGAGVANAPFGRVRLSATGNGQFEANCIVFDGSGQLVTGAGTLQLSLPGPGRACLTGSELQQAEAGGQVNVAANLDARGTEGAVLGRHGRLKARGAINTATGAFTVNLSGRLRR